MQFVKKERPKAQKTVEGLLTLSPFRVKANSKTNEKPPATTFESLAARRSTLGAARSWQ